MDEVAIKVENLSKKFKLPHEKSTSLKSALINSLRPGARGYELQEALKNISFEVKKGEFFGIVGRNGSGKSTLLKLLAGIYTPTEGGVTVNGKLTPFIELGVGFNPELTGRENVFLNGALLGFNRKEMQALYKDIVSFAELEKFMDQKLKNYSSGMQVRLAFSIAIRAKSDILLLDEVLAVGDAAFQQKCYNYFEELKRKKHTVVFVSHDMAAIKRFCTNAIYIKDGRLTHTGSQMEVADIYVAENIESERVVGSKNSSSKTHTIEAKVYRPNPQEVQMKVNYQSKKRDKLYVGLSIQKEGISIAEITTPLDKPLSGRGSLTYVLNTDAFNPGMYNIGIGLFELTNRELVGVVKSKNTFTVKGDDLTKGGALKLADSWSYK